MIWRGHLSIVDSGNYCEATFRAGCQPLSVLTGCHFLITPSLLREGHSLTPALQSFFVLTGVLHFPPPRIPGPYLITPFFDTTYCSHPACVVRRSGCS